MNKLRVFEAFAGIGTQSMALKEANVYHEVVGFLENNKTPEEIYVNIHNVDKNLNHGDIKIVDEKFLPDFDFFTYSFPCKNISNAGKSEGIIRGINNSGLLWECDRIIREKKPKYLFMENVKNLVSKKHKPHLEEWIKNLEDIGYSNYYKILNAKNYGVPQNRERVFMISILGEHEPYEFPDPIPLTISACDLMEESVDESLYIKCDLKTNKEGQVLIPQATKKGYIELNISGICDLTFPNSKTRRGRVQEGGRICPTLTATKTPIIYIDNQYRARNLSCKEYWRLMGIKDEYFDMAKKLNISDIQLYERAGRGIVVSCMVHMFNKLFKEYIIN